MRDVTRAKISSLCGAIWRTILSFYDSQGEWVNCYRIHQKSLNFIYPFKFYSNFTNKNVSWLHFSWATQYNDVALWSAESAKHNFITAVAEAVITAARRCSARISLSFRLLSWSVVAVRCHAYLTGRLHGTIVGLTGRPDTGYVRPVGPTGRSDDRTM